MYLQLHKSHVFFFFLYFCIFVSVYKEKDFFFFPSFLHSDTVQQLTTDNVRGGGREGNVYVESGARKIES